MNSYGLDWEFGACGFKFNCKYIHCSILGSTSIIGVAGEVNRGHTSLPSTTVRKNVPKSSNPLKSFNWSKLPDCKVI